MRRLLSPLLTLTALLAAPGPVHAQPAYPSPGRVVRVYDDQTPLNATVYGIMQDSKGFIWFTTKEGLLRYDGYRIKSYLQKPKVNNGLFTNNLLDIAEGENGKLWVATIRGLYAFDPLSEHFMRIPSDPAMADNVGSQAIFSVRTDVDGTPWFSTNTAGYGMYNPKNAQTAYFFYDTTIEDRYYSSFASGVWLNRSKRQVWAAVNQGGVWRLCRTDLTDAKRLESYEMPGFQRGFNIFRVLEDHTGRVWLATDLGLWYLDTQKNVCVSASGLPGLPDVLAKTRVISLHEGTDHTLWIGTFVNGLYGYHPATGQVVHYPFVDQASDSGKSPLVSCIYEDQNGALWVGLRNNSIFRIERTYNSFHYQEFPRINPSELTVDAATVDQNGNLYFVSNYGEIYETNAQTGKTIAFRDRLPALSRSLASFCIYSDKKNNLWLGLNGKGMLQINPDRNNFKHFSHDPERPNGLSSLYAKAITADEQGNLWIGTWGGLNKYLPEKDSFITFRHEDGVSNSLLNNSVNCLLNDSKGRLWVGVRGGASIFMPESGGFVPVVCDTNPDLPLLINNIFEDRVGRVWLATNFGLYRVTPGEPEPAKWRVDYIGESQGLPASSVWGILEDKHQRFWMTTSNGLACLFNPYETGARLRFINYNRDFNWRSPVFYDENLFRAPDGKLFFCCSNGLLYIHEDSVYQNSRPPQIAITALEKYNTDFPERPAELETGVSHRSEVRLSYKNNIFTIEFAALDFRAPEQNKYAYRMSGFNDNWIELGNQRRVTFTNLDPGTYYFTVKGCNHDGVWNEEGVTLKIVITPPWWRTVWAYIAYALLFAAAVAAFIRMRTRYLENRAKELERAVKRGTEQIVAQKEKIEQQALELQELERIKWRFYTNITHELRTPLTLMLGPLSTLLKGKSPNAPDFHLLKIAQQNGRKLFRRVSEMLDFSKLESENIELTEKPVRIASLTSRLVGNFESHAQFLGVDLSHRIDIAPERTVLLDTDKYETIVDNLLSNALKFTSRGGWVRVSLEEPEAGVLRLTVRDNGPGIHPQDLPHIFNRYYQTRYSDVSAEGGTGIGLALCAELARLFGGDIRADSAPGAGSAFVVEWPVTDTADPDTPGEQAWYPPVSAAPAATPAAERTRPEGIPRLLVVEDNPDLQAFLVHLLSDAYVVNTAPNGEEALQWLDANAAPDLILSDIMMPHMDGYQLLDRLKSDDRYRHIPVVLLTARADISDRLRALRAGVHDYLTKPFEEEELTTRIENLLRHGQARRTARGEEGNSVAAGAVMSEADAEWLASLEQWTRENLGSDLLNVPAMAQQMNLSERQLQRRLRETTGMSPQQYLQELRLTAARDLLERGVYRTVAEAAYAAGFGHPKVFSRAYRERFGRLPSTYF